MKTAVNQLQLSAQAYHRMIKLSRTIADLAGSSVIGPSHLALRTNGGGFAVPAEDERGLTMAKAPDWTPEEFETLLRSPNEKDDSLNLQLPKRTQSAIQAVRGGIHAFHTGGKFSLLSLMMVRRL